MDLQVNTQYITGTDGEIALAIAEELARALRNLGMKDPDESAMAEHGHIEEDEDGSLTYCWDDIKLFKTEPMLIMHGVRIIR